MAKIRMKNNAKKINKRVISSIPGKAYFADWPFCEKTELSEVRKRLGKFKNNLSDELVKYRMEERI